MPLYIEPEIHALLAKAPAAQCAAIMAAAIDKKRWLQRATLKHHRTCTAATINVELTWPSEHLDHVATSFTHRGYSERGGATAT